MPARSILIVGESASGKSTSIETLNPEETFIINVYKAELPFKGWKKKYTIISGSNPKGNLLNTDKTVDIIKTMEHVSKNMPNIKNLIIDDCQFTMSFELMRRSKETGFGKFTDIARSMFDLATKPKDLRDDLTVIYTFHAEEGTDINQNRRLKAKTAGKMIDNVITLEGLFNIVLFSQKEETLKDGTKYYFITNGDPMSTAKSPRGLFESKIPNDLAYVLERIKEYEEGD